MARRYRRLTRAGIAALALSLAPLAGVAQAGQNVDAKGPIGWDTYRQLDRLGEPVSGVSTHQFSSFDRTGGNSHDGFDGRFSCLRNSADGCVIAEREGAGEIQSIWFTRDEGDVRKTGNIKIELDGRTVLDAPLADVVDGKLGAPWEFPLVANADQSSGGVHLKVPMPYRSAMRVTTTNNPLFYHVSYRRFADANGVDTFNPKDRAADVLAMFKQAGQRDPKPRVRRSARATRKLNLAPGRSVTLARLRGRGAISEFALKFPQLIGPTTGAAITDDGRAFDADGYSEFTVKIDPNNKGVRLTRRYAPVIGNQRARVLVDGKAVTEWQPRPVVRGGGWRNDSVQLPASATAGKDRITIRNEFISSDLDFNEFIYWVDSLTDGEPKRTDTVDVGPLSTDDERAHTYSIKNQNWQGYDANHDADAPEDKKRIAASDEILRDTRVRFTFDGKKTVDAPLGEFFGSGLGEYEVRSLMFSLDPNGWYRSWWPMTYKRGAKIELYNGSSKAISSGEASVTWNRRSSRLAQTFNATSRRGTPEPGRDWQFIDQAGSGKFVGVNHTMEGSRDTGNRRGYLEGDERVYIDGSLTPTLHGTGTEDFYEAGWYFNRGMFSRPTNGNTGHENSAFGCKQLCDSAYRLMIGDAVPFANDLRFGIEPGPASDESGTYGSTAFWYGNAERRMQRTDTIDIANPASERAHAYSGGGEPIELRSTFEGNDDESPVTDVGRATRDRVSFRLRVGEGNEGVVLRRRSDQSVGYQAAEVFVDGRRAGVWRQPLRNEFHRWLEDGFEMPARLTAGKDELKIQLRPLADGGAWHAARYVALARVPAFADRRAPGRVTGLRAESDRGVEIALSWNEADDDVAIDRYELFGSKDPNFAVGPATKLGESRSPSFRFTDAGLEETWYFRVRAIDTAENVGPLSEPASVTSGSVLVFEAERLLPPVATNTAVESQSNCCGVTWSGGAQLFMRADAVERFVTVRLRIPRAGAYTASAQLVRAPDYGIAAFELDGKRIGEPFDGYSSRVEKPDPVDLGRLDLTAGDHQLTLKVIDRNPAANGFLAGFDVLELERVGD